MAGPGNTAECSPQLPPTLAKLMLVLDLYPTPVRHKIEDTEGGATRGRRCMLNMKEPANFDEAKGEETC
jgi:hypothetical protein